MSRIKKAILSVLPGIFLIGYNIGTGSVTAMSKAGANFGTGLLWAVLISCIITYYLINHFSKYSMVTGNTFIQGMREHINPGLTIIMLVALSVIIISALVALLGIISEILNVWLLTVYGINISIEIWAVIIGAALYILLWIGNYSFFEKVLAVFVSIMGIAFIATAAMNFPPLSEIGSGFIPAIPQSAVGSDNGSLVIVAGMIGTTVSVFVFIIRSQIVNEIGWKMSDNAIQKRDAQVSATMMFIFGSAIIITAAATLHARGIRLNNVVEMIPLMEPIAGTAAITVFTIGILAAGLSSHLPNLLVIPWLIIDYKKLPRNTQTPSSRILLFILTLISILGVSLGFKPVFIMMLSQACISVVLPLTIASVFYLTSRKSIMNEYKNSLTDIIILSFIMLFSLYVSWLGIRGLIFDLTNIG